ncbi:hypothetical protein Tco_0308391 [Tanacetum coccineum]
MMTLADKSLLSGGDNKPPMLEKHLYDSWKSIMELYMMNRPHGRMILASVEKSPLVWPTITVDGVTRPKEYTELTPAETIQADCDIKAINIILQGLPTKIYALVSQHHVAKDIWEKIRLLMQGMSLTKQERESKLYDEFDKFTYKKGESLHEYYLRFTLLLNDMNIYKMLLEQFQVNTKFLNTLLADGANSLLMLTFWSKNSVNSPKPTLSSRPTKVEVPKELPKVSMVDTSLKKLKHHLAGFDVVVKERTTPTAIIEGSWGFKHTKACFRDEIIPFVKALKDNSVSNKSALSFDQLFELNELKAQSQEKDTVIKKLKERIKSLSGKMNEDKIKKDLEEIETINIELDHRVSKLIAKNEHLKQTYKQLYDSIKPARIQSKEQCEYLINQVNLKSVEIFDLNARLQEKVLIITVLKDDLRKLKGKSIVDNEVT